MAATQHNTTGPQAHLYITRFTSIPNIPVSLELVLFQVPSSSDPHTLSRSPWTSVAVLKPLLEATLLSKSRTIGTKQITLFRFAHSRYNFYSRCVRITARLAFC